MRVLMVWLRTGTGDLEACDEKDDPWAADALQGIFGLRQEKQSFLVVFKDFPENYRSALENVVSNAYARFRACETRLPSHTQTGRILRHT